MTDTTGLSIEQALDLCRTAALAAGATRPAAEALARASVAAEAQGQRSVGLSHLIDHLDALRAGRINGDARPVISRPAPALILSDADGGIAQLGFDLAVDDLVATARDLGIALFAQKNAYTSGALGLYASRLAAEGLVAIAATSGPPLVAGSGGTRPVFCTNPLAFAAPRKDGPPLLIDQSSSATAFVNIRDAAREGRKIPSGWALDAAGHPTTDAQAAVKGALLAFGGERGANIALMIEVLAAGVTGTSWALDAPPFAAGSQSPDSGLLIIAIEPKLLDPTFEARMAGQIDRLKHDYGVYIPGDSKAAAVAKAEVDGLLVAVETIDVLNRWIAGDYV